MKHWESKDYRKVNESFRRRLVYHVGNEYGFFVELKYFTLLLLGTVSTLESLAQMTVDTIQYRFVYDVQMKTIEGSTSLDNDEHWLDIGKKGISSYYSNWKVQRLHLIDSIMSVGGTSADVIKEAQKQGFETSYFNYVICQNYPVQGQQTINYYSLQQLQYTEDMGMNWELEDGDTLILGHQCNKAITTYHGRIWTAWYAPDIPLMEGPWKLYDLPGLILRATDDRNEYVFIRIRGTVPVIIFNLHIFCITPNDTPVSLESCRMPAPNNFADLSTSSLRPFSRLWTIRGLAMPCFSSRNALISLSLTCLSVSASISNIPYSSTGEQTSSASSPRGILDNTALVAQNPSVCDTYSDQLLQGYSDT